jgi:hypothetical protein
VAEKKISTTLNVKISQMVMDEIERFGSHFTYKVATRSYSWK